MTDQKERLKKLYALAMRGVGGEKETAQAILDKLLKKYAMTIDDLDEEVIQEYELEYHGKEQDRILMQTVYKVTDEKDTFACRHAIAGNNHYKRAHLYAYLPPLLLLIGGGIQPTAARPGQSLTPPREQQKKRQ